MQVLIVGACMVSALCDPVNSKDSDVDTIHCDPSSAILEAVNTYTSLPSIITNGKENGNYNYSIYIYIYFVSFPLMLVFIFTTDYHPSLY